MHFSFCVFSGSAFSSTFCVSSLLSEALGFSAGYTRVVTVTALWFSSPFSQFTFSTFSISVFSSLCLVFLVVSGLLGKLFATGCRYWVCLGFLLPPCTFCGLLILLWGRVKVVGSDLLCLTVGIPPCRFLFSPNLKNICEQGGYFIQLVRRCSS